MTVPDLVLHDVELDGRSVDVGVVEGHVATIAPSLPRAATSIDAAGGALLPGLWDHHMHLLATAAALRSVELGDGVESMVRALRDADRQLPTGEWIRAVGHHESVTGHLDRAGLDGIVPDRPVRVQHRSGGLWVLNSAACAQVGLDDPDGMLLGRDAWLRERLPDEAPDLAAVSRTLARHGVTGVTDMTPVADPSSWSLLANAARIGALSQRVVVTGGPELARATAPDPLMVGPVKLYLADHALPGLDVLAEQVGDAHAAGRAVAFHSVTRASLVLAVAAVEVAGRHEGDRIEHGAVVPPELAERLAALRMTVVTQPAFLADRGDRYLDEVEAVDVPHLYPCRRLLGAGVPVAGSTDAPFGPVDPWRAIASATERTAPDGRRVGDDEPLTAADALALFLGAPDDPGGPARIVAVGSPADLCLLSAPMAAALDDPASVRVRATVIGGDVVHLDA